ncbi:hypothetical protein K2X33_13710, partial [bacterium]|nr:hypothetical protein [bacterium]
MVALQGLLANGYFSKPQAAHLQMLLGEAEKKRTATAEAAKPKAKRAQMELVEKAYGIERSGDIVHESSRVATAIKAARDGDPKPMASFLASMRTMISNKELDELALRARKELNDSKAMEDLDHRTLVDSLLKMAWANGSKVVPECLDPKSLKGGKVEIIKDVKQCYGENESYKAYAAAHEPEQKIAAQHTANYDGSLAGFNDPKKSKADVLEAIATLQTSPDPHGYLGFLVRQSRESQDVDSRRRATQALDALQRDEAGNFTGSIQLKGTNGEIVQTISVDVPPGVNGTPADEAGRKAQRALQTKLISDLRTKVAQTLEREPAKQFIYKPRMAPPKLAANQPIPAGGSAGAAPPAASPAGGGAATPAPSGPPLTTAQTQQVDRLLSSFGNVKTQGQKGCANCHDSKYTLQRTTNNGKQSVDILEGSKPVSRLTIMNKFLAQAGDMADVYKGLSPTEKAVLVKWAAEKR